MPSTFSDNLKLELMATGENAGTWGSKTNSNLNLIQQAISGYEEIDVASADVDLEMINASVSNARNMVLNFTGTLDANRTVTIPNNIKKFYVLIDSTTHGAFSLTVKVDNVSSQGFTLVQDKSHFCYSNGSELNLISGAEIANITLDAVLSNGDTSSGDINVSNINISAATTCNTITATSSIEGNLINSQNDITTQNGDFVAQTGNVRATAGDISDSKGEIRSVPVLTKSSTYTLLASDHGKVIRTSGSIKVPQNVFSAGQTITIYNNSSGNISISRNSGVVMYWSQTGSNSNRTLKGRGVATILCESSNRFVITGGTLT